MFWAVRRGNEPDKIRGPSKSKHYLGKGDICLGSVRNFHVCHLTLKFAQRCWETILRSKISCSFQVEVSLRYKKVKSSWQTRKAYCNSQYLYEIYTLHLLLKRIWSSFEITKCNKVKRNICTHTYKINTHLFPPNQGKRKVLRVKSWRLNAQQGREDRDEKPRNAQLLLVSTPNQPFLRYLVWTQLSNRHWRGLSLTSGLELSTKIK